MQSTIHFFKQANNMKKVFFLLPLLAVLSMAAKMTYNYNVDVKSSNIVWKGYKVTGEHTGDVKLKNGSLQFADGKLSGGSFEVDMNSITCKDMQGEYGDKLVGHLKSEDFFGVSKYPTAKFTITRAIPQDTKGNYKIIGNLKIKESTKEVKFFANVSEQGNMVKATGTMKVDRSEYNIQYGSGSFFDNLGDKTIYDEFDLAVELTAKK
jgi:polyisoprenoid-binding protein YceI